jgi:hypothetical protein
LARISSGIARLADVVEGGVMRDQRPQEASVAVRPHPAAMRIRAIDATGWDSAERRHTL